jgi:hypothetical protein
MLGLIAIPERDANCPQTDPGPPMTLGNAAAARFGLNVWCKACQHQVEPDPAEMAARYGAGVNQVKGRGFPRGQVNLQAEQSARQACL